jgi:peptidoglycan/LPS O-acetylase OafA/YrhL
MAKPIPKPIPFYKDPDFLRPQTWLLFLALACNVLTYVLPVSVLDLSPGLVRVLPNRVVGVLAGSKGLLANLQGGSETGALFGVSVAILAVVLVSLVVYRRRALQQKIVALAAILFLAGIAVGYFTAKGLSENLPSTHVYPSWGSAFLLLGSVLCLLAVARIRADIRKLKSSERFW